MTTDETRDLADIFRLLGEANRLSLVIACLGGPLGVGALAERTGLGQSLVSHHLRLLRAARLLRATRAGRQIFYAIADDHVRQMLSNMIEHIAEPLGADGVEGEER